MSTPSNVTPLDRNALLWNARGCETEMGTLCGRVVMELVPKEWFERDVTKWPAESHPEWRAHMRGVFFRTYQIELSDDDIDALIVTGLGHVKGRARPLTTIAAELNCDLRRCDPFRLMHLKIRAEPNANPVDIAAKVHMFCHLADCSLEKAFNWEWAGRARQIKQAVLREQESHDNQGRAPLKEKSQVTTPSQ